jgi:Tetratricopeptide repeat
MPMLRSLGWCLGLGTAAAAVTLGTITVPPFAAALVGSAVGGATGNFGHEVFKVLDQRVLGKLLVDRSGIAENHVVVQALRLAQLNALRAILSRFDIARKHDRNPERVSEASRISAELASFIANETKAANTLAFATTADSTPLDQALRQEVLKTLPAAFDEGLASRRIAGDETAITESVAQIRRIVETAVLAELRLILFAPGEEFPALFSTLFSGTDTTAGWFDLFLRDAADRIKAADGEDDGAFEKIWNAEQTALIKAIAEANRTILERLDTRTERIEQAIEDQQAGINELLALARSGGFFRRAAEQGISEAAVRAIVERLGGEGIGRDDLLLWLENWIDAAQRELGRSGNENEAFETARREAERLFKLGRIADASSPFMDAFEQEERAETERQQERKRRRLLLLEEAIRFDELALNGAAAARKLRLAAEVEGITGSDPIGVFLFEKAAEFYKRGDQLGDNAALLVAIAAYRAALEERTRERVPLDWAATQNDLGAALLTLGERESGTARLEQAVAAYRAALEERTRERVPLDWAITQNNLSAALSALGERESGTARLEQAVAACRAALEEWTHERGPLQWATTQNNLGTALSTLGERESETARLEEAVAAYRAALEERTRERVPLQWAMMQSNLGIALWKLGERETGTARLEEAVAAYRAALEEWTRECGLLRWAMMRNNLSNAQTLLNERLKSLRKS